MVQSVQRASLERQGRRFLLKWEASTKNLGSWWRYRSTLDHPHAFASVYRVVQTRHRQWQSLADLKEHWRDRLQRCPRTG